MRSATASSGRSEFFHLPVPKPRTDEAFYVPALERLNMKPGTDLYLGLIHRDDDAGAARLATAKRHAGVDGIGTECGMAAATRNLPRAARGAHELADAKV